ncbi:hypothetical protein BC830DRAFT_1107375 [Chytriomyces sp. MP71]|nr:hypothetical protein BC830DRAFT_1107375 [Chytriomyces sp. MP71]
MSKIEKGAATDATSSLPAAYIDSHATLIGSTTPASALKPTSAVGNAIQLANSHSLQSALTPSSSLSLNGTPIPPGSACHGKVANIEAMVPAQWWEEVFCDSMYLKTDGDVVEDPDVTRQEVEMLERDDEIKRIFEQGADGKDAPSRILDLCCGQGRHTIHISKTYPHLDCHGHDQSAYLVSLARDRTASTQGSAHFTVGDCRTIPHPNEHFDLLLLMGNSFGYFKAEDGDGTLLAEIWRVLKPGGRVVLDLTDGAFMRAHFACRSWEWVDDCTFVCRERQLSADGLRLCSREVITATNKGVVRDQFYQERLYSREELNELVKEYGFEVVPVPSEQKVKLSNDVIASMGEMIIAEQMSKRKEDLGMMGHRMIVTAIKRDDTVPPLLRNVEDSVFATIQQPKPEPGSMSIPILNADHATEAITEFSAAPPLFESLVVILGDPSQACVGKLNNTWNNEDFITRDKLILALKELGYATGKNLRVLDAHSTLHQNLKHLNPKKQHFIFNLCDEGFDNNALQELHVPAILEMLRIPYSGAGPNCLAFCYDKGLVNRTADALGVPTPREISFLGDVSTPAVSNMEALHDVINQKIDYPAFIKPIKGDNSLGITARSIVHNQKDLESYMSELHEMGIRDVVVQEYCQGTEYGVGMIGNLASGFHFFPILEVDYSKIIARKLAPILGFESKWDPNSPWWNDISYKPAVISDKVREELYSWCIVLWERFGCRDYARFDFRCDFGRGDGFEAPGERRGTIKLLEVNPNPGWCWDGKFAYMGSFEKKDYKDVLGMILKAAHDRTVHEKNQKTIEEAAASK